MNEFDILAGARSEAPPDPAVVAGARGQLLAAIERDAMVVAAAAPPVRRKWRLLGWTLAPVAALAALAVAATMTFGPNTVDRPPASARDILLAAADRSLTAPTSGAYWSVDTEDGTPIDVGPAGSPYTIMGRTRMRTWIPAGGRGAIVNSAQWLGAAPATAADRAKWQRDGSPTSWPKEAPPGCPATGKWTSTQGTATANQQPSERFVLALDEVTGAELRALPTDPAALKRALLASIDHPGEAETAQQIAERRTERLFSAAVQLLILLPVTPEVRAAAYRMLADLPDVRVLGAVTDPKGRAGEAVAITHPRDDGDGMVEQRLVVDPDGGALAIETRTPAGALVQYRAVIGGGWTDKAPPAAPATGGYLRGEKC